jgi:hypothetical protein
MFPPRSKRNNSNMATDGCLAMSAPRVCQISFSLSIISHSQRGRGQRGWSLLTQPTTKAKSSSVAGRQGKRVSHASLEVQPQRWTATKKEPRAVHSRGLQLALFEALLSRRLRGCRGGTGVSRRKGLLAVGVLPDPARVIQPSQFGAFRAVATDRAKFSPQYFPGRALWCLIGGRTIRTGKGVLGKKLLFLRS